MDNRPYISVTVERRQNLGQFNHEIITASLNRVPFDTPAKEVDEMAKSVDYVVQSLGAQVRARIGEIRQESKPKVDPAAFDDGPYLISATVGERIETESVDPTWRKVSSIMGAEEWDEVAAILGESGGDAVPVVLEAVKNGADAWSAIKDFVQTYVDSIEIDPESGEPIPVERTWGVPGNVVEATSLVHPDAEAIGDQSFAPEELRAMLPGYGAVLKNILSPGIAVQPDPLICETCGGECRSKDKRMCAACVEAEMARSDAARLAPVLGDDQVATPNQETRNVLGVDIQVPPADWFDVPLTEAGDADLPEGSSGQLKAINAGLTGAGFSGSERHAAATVILKTFSDLFAIASRLPIESTRDLTKGDAHIVLSFLESAQPSALSAIRATMTFRDMTTNQVAIAKVSQTAKVAPEESSPDADLAKPKRKRRTKAEIQAEKDAEVAKQNEALGIQAVIPVPVTEAVEPVGAVRVTFVASGECYVYQDGKSGPVQKFNDPATADADLAKWAQENGAVLGEISDARRPKTVACNPAQAGFIQCQECEGTGKTENMFQDDGYDSCQVCNGRGTMICPTCRDNPGLAVDPFEKDPAKAILGACPTCVPEGAAPAIASEPEALSVGLDELVEDEIQPTVQEPVFDPSPKIVFSESQERAINLIREARGSNRVLFVTGKAGTGKSTVLNWVRDHFRVVVMAPTGLAAVNVGGVTIHRFFKFKPGPLTLKQDALGDKEAAVLRAAEAIIVDEVSMVRADVLDAMNRKLQKTLGTKLPFGGKLLVLVGDMWQLEPVVSEGEEQKFIQRRYKSPFWFDALVLTDPKSRKQDSLFDDEEEPGALQVETVELVDVFRQKDEAMVEALNKVRVGDFDGLSFFNTRVGASLPPGEPPVAITFGNRKAKAINETRLGSLPGAERKYKAVVEGEMKDSELPADLELSIKVGAQVMFIRNGLYGPSRTIIGANGEPMEIPDLDSCEYVSNGEVGKVLAVDGEYPLVELRDGRVVLATPTTWEKIEYGFNVETDEITETVIARFVQIPLRLAWAITTHKAQGQTLETAVIEAEIPAFAHGQLYVALSRVKSPEGLILRRRLAREDLFVNKRVREFLGVEAPKAKMNLSAFG